MNGLSTAPATYLPSKKSQLASQSRIAKINDLYERRQRQHRDSVVSNNSTSVLSEDNCVPINGLKYRVNGQHNVEETFNTVKHEKLPSEFPINAQEQQSPLPRDDEEDYEAELKFTPRLRSRRSLLTMRKTYLAHDPPTTSSDEVSPVENIPPTYETPLPSERRQNRAASLRKTLGDPLPLPYLSKDTEPSSKPRVRSPPGTAAVDRKRQMMEYKWRKLVSQDKSIVETRLRNIRRPSLATDEPLGCPDSPTLIAEQTTDTLSQGSLEELQQEIITNREKLDQIIGLLKERKNFALPFNFHRYHLDYPTKFWTICIIMLTLCNIYVYYYL